MEILEPPMGRLRQNSVEWLSRLTWVFVEIEGQLAEPAGVRVCVD